MRERMGTRRDSIWDEDAITVQLMMLVMAEESEKRRRDAANEGWFGDRR